MPGYGSWVSTLCGGPPTVDLAHVHLGRACRAGDSVWSGGEIARCTLAGRTIEPDPPPERLLLSGVQARHAVPKATHDHFKIFGRSSMDPFQRRVTMTELLAMASDDGASIFVEIEETEPGFEIATRGDGVIAEARRRFDESLGDIKHAAESALRTFAADGPFKPSGVEIEFGVRFNAEVGAVIAKTALEGHLVVKLSWADRQQGKQ